MNNLVNKNEVSYQKKILAQKINNLSFLSSSLRLVIGIVIHFILGTSDGAIETTCMHEAVEWTVIGQNLALETCYPDVSEVDDEDFTISTAEDSKILGLYINDKQGVKFLPRNLFKNFPDLIAMEVSSCNVTAVDENNFKRLSKLRALSLSQNQIERVSSDAFSDLSSLESLALINNRIQSFEKNTFAALKALKTLYLNDNEIHFLHPDTFNSLVNVEEINLSNNKLLGLTENIFWSLTNLTIIDLSYNNLTAIHKHLFEKNVMLKEIWMNQNQIVFIDANAFDHLSSLEVVNLEDNACINGNYDEPGIIDLKDDSKQDCNVKGTSQSLPKFISKTAICFSIFYSLHRKFLMI